MNEAQWLASNDPVAMLYPLTGYGAAGQPATGFRHVNAKSLPRKLRLWACACCRQVWDGTACLECDGTGLIVGVGDFSSGCVVCSGTGRVGGLTDPRSRRAVEVAERFADGEATKEESTLACQRAFKVDGCNWDELTEANRNAPCMACWSASTEESAATIARRVGHHGVVPPPTQAALLRCVVGNPFRPVAKVSGKLVVDGGVDEVGNKVGLINLYPPGWVSWMDWKDGTVPKIAAAIYQERAWDRLPVLADALEEAGVADEVCHWDLPHNPPYGVGIHNCSSCDGTGRAPNPLLAHLRGPGPHCRGCWVIDLLLGKG